MKGAEILVKALEREGVDLVFGYPGGAIMPVYDALVESKLKHVLVRHEQAAALAADGYARATGKVGVCLATSGPGATNLVTGIANAFLDSVPLVAITGQVPSPFMGTDAFQEVDTFGITMPVVKHSFIARDASQLASLIQEAFEIAREGRPGPVLIDLPKDVANAEVADPFPVLGLVPPASEDIYLELADQEEIMQARQLMQASKRPLVYAGGGIRIARACAEFREFVRATGMPVVTTLQGIGAIPGTDRQCLGMLGMHGSKAANYAVQGCDLLICIGARFDDRVTGKLQEFAPEAKVIHMDIDPSEISKLRFAHCALQGDIKSSMQALHISPQIDEWMATCLENKKLYEYSYEQPTRGVNGPKLLRQLSQQAEDNTFISCDVGQHQMWVAQHYLFDRPECHLSSGGLGTMGFGLPAAIGVQMAYPQARCICVSGDGSIMMNIQELATVRRYGLPIKIILFDNQALGMVRQWQELFFAERYSEVDLSDNPDFAKVAEAFGMPSIKVQSDEDLAEAIRKVVYEPGSLFVHVLIDPKENVWPLVPPGKSNSEMMEASCK